MPFRSFFMLFLAIFTFFGQFYVLLAAVVGFFLLFRVRWQWSSIFQGDLRLFLPFVDSLGFFEVLQRPPGASPVRIEGRDRGRMRCCAAGRSPAAIGLSRRGNCIYGQGCPTRV